ncbi:MAG TPA: hypothetical protein VI408_03090 [Gaiellaceae bacterium]
MKLEPFATAAAAAAALVAATTGVAATPTERVILASGAHLSASAVVGSAGTGTRVAFTVSGARPHAELRAILNAGTCRRRSASFAAAGSARADSRGHAAWATRLRFHGGDVRWATVSDGAHVLVLIVNGKAAACAAIPGMS